MTRIITYGTFDLLHIGHLNLLERLRAMGDELIVGVSTDAFNDIKGKKAVMAYEDRVRLVAALRCVSSVLPEEDWAQKEHDIQRLRVDVLAMGDDWEGRFDHFKQFCEVVYLPRTDGISTTFLRETIAERSGFVSVTPDAHEVISIQSRPTASVPPTPTNWRETA